HATSRTASTALSLPDALPISAAPPRGGAPAQPRPGLTSDSGGVASGGTELVGLPQVRAAAEILAGVAVRTPLLTSGWSERLWLKPESLQPTGAFKLRGAYHAVARLPEPQRKAGVVTHSSGNHGQALAWAARSFEIPCVVVMPDVAPAHKIAAVRRLGAEVVLVPPAQRAERAASLAAERGLQPVPPFDHPDVIAGQGTVGL